MILSKQPSIEDAKHPSELIAHIEPAGDDLLAGEDQIEVVEDDSQNEGDVAEDAS